MRPSVFLQTLLLITTLFAPVLSFAGVVSKVANFSEGDLADWEEKSFEGNSQYRFVDAQTAGINSQEIKDKQQVLRASTQGKASGLFKEVNIDLTKTPYLNWSWQVQNLFKDNDEHSKEGDDYPARIYVVVSGGVFFWNTKAINYVWSSNQPVGSEWPNAFTGNAKMLAVRSGEKQLGQWVTERRNVREDLKKFFGEDVKKIDAIAVMVDGDNTGQSATAYFGDIFFSD
ncbi:hypothetical protein MNBD_GAMMA19-1191 [hydrothermal vent metagenome]|uniref:DUF3047 domain-containing protein n=1 Tax=hydrothermal vent metagenome TaxID=652676 RepID=A0A3B1AT09_9ZZZZ